MIVINNWSPRLIKVCAAGIIVNVAGALISTVFQLDMYMDAFGTIFVAALGGYVPGVAVGFFTNWITMFFLDNKEVYFGVVNVLIALLTAFLAEKGYYKKFSKVLLTIPATIIMTSLLGAFFEKLLVFSVSFDSLQTWERIWEQFIENFFKELPFKSFSIIFTFFALKFIPTEFKESFLLLGKMQAPVSAEMRRAIKAHENSNNKFVTSLRTKMIAQLLLVTIFIAGIISLISYNIYTDSAVSERKQLADGIVTMAINEIDPRRVDEFLELGFQAEGYSEVRHKLTAIRASNSDVKYLYVYKIMEDGCHVVFDVDTADVAASSPGSIEDFDESFEKYLPDLLAGRPIVPIINDDKYGYLLTIYKPVYNSEGHCTCYVGIDFSMERIHDYGRLFIIEVIALFSGALIFIFILSLLFIENNIILPVNTMAYCAKNFAYDSEEAREHNIERMKSLEIKTHDEIENLYSAFLKTTADSMHYFENLKRSKIQLAVMDELAHKDALTGLKNKTSYNQATSILDADIAEGHAKFAIIMVDVNYLKRVNDTYGHERGNDYLINAGKLICKIFGEERVYRVGGDEFVVILDGEALAHCEDNVKKIRSIIKNFGSDESLQPWEKISAAIGVAHYTPRDNSADEVFKRADSEMYKNKLAMKAARTD